MIRFTKGNLLESDVDALVNTVNTVGVMGKGIALMFKEAFPDNFKEYEAACKHNEVVVGRMFVTRRRDLVGPKWIINFPTKKHWRQPSKMEWIVAGLHDLKRVIQENGIRSIALPPLGSGNGGLVWADVRDEIESALGDLAGIEIVVFEPTEKYQNVAKREGVQKLTPARALVAELVRRYWVIGVECTILEIQKLGYFLERMVVAEKVVNELDFKFEANRFGPYSIRLTHLLNALDGSYLHCDKRLSDAGPFDVIWFDDGQRDKVSAYLTTPEAKIYRSALERTEALIDGFQSPFGLELLATVDWLIAKERVAHDVEAIREGLAHWIGDKKASERKQKMFDSRVLSIALRQLEAVAPSR